MTGGWLATQPGVTTPILGVRTVEQLAQNLASFDFSIPAELRQKLDEVSALPLTQPYNFFKPPRNHFVVGNTSVRGWSAAKLYGR